MSDRIDLAILGGGLAGLALARRLAASGAGGRVVVIEPRKRYEDDRSWSFWTPAYGPWAAAATRTWRRWRFSARGGASVPASAKGWRYAYLRSSAFYDEALRAIADAPHITLALGHRVDTLAITSSGVEVSTSAGTLVARHVVDTRPPEAARLAGARMLQSFAGREIALQAPGIDDGEAEVMTDMRVDAHGFVFSYVLPLSPTRVLVEATRFTTVALDAGVLEDDLDSLIAARGWAGAPVLRAERAVLPMGLPGFTDDAAMPGLVRAGVGGGALRAASGYGFLRIQSWAAHCAAALARGAVPSGHPREPRLRAWMDAVFLCALAVNPERAPEFFMCLAGAVPGAAFARFMSDSASRRDLLHVIAALPPGPFLRALGLWPARAGEA